MREIGELIAAEAGAEEFDSPGALKLSRKQCFEQIKLLEGRHEIETALSKLRQAYSGHYLRQIERGEFDA